MNERGPKNSNVIDFQKWCKRRNIDFTQRSLGKERYDENQYDLPDYLLNKTKRTIEVILGLDADNYIDLLTGEREELGKLLSSVDNYLDKLHFEDLKDEEILFIHELHDYVNKILYFVRDELVSLDSAVDIDKLLSAYE